MEERKNFKEFLKSQQLWNISKELLVIILGVTLAINFTSAVEEKETKEKVIKMLESTTSEIKGEIDLNRFLLELYEEGKIGSKEIQNNAKSNIALIENVLTNDKVIFTMSPVMHTALINDAHNVSSQGDKIDEIEGGALTMVVENINRDLEKILWEIEAEIRYLRGIYTEEELTKLYALYVELQLTSYEDIDIDSFDLEEDGEYHIIR